MAEDPKTREIAIPLPPNEKGQQRVLRVRGDEEGPKEAKVGVLFPMTEGQPIPLGSDIIAVRPSENGRHLEVRTVYEASESDGKGGWRPMRVSKKTFDSNWSRTFGSKVDKTLN